MREYETPSPLPCTPKELDMLLDKWIVKPQPNFQGTHRKGTKGPAFLPFVQLCVTPYRRMLGALQTDASQNQRRNSQVISTRSPKKPTPEPQGKSSSSNRYLRGSKGRQRRKASPACRSNYHFIEKFQVQEPV